VPPQSLVDAVVDSIKDGRVIRLHATGALAVAGATHPSITVSGTGDRGGPTPGRDSQRSARSRGQAVRSRPAPVS